ncbi:mechanosensitive ion channel domain-containing protein [Sulfurovum sp.]|uniref:mechanosensitive ion channel family protein n=1 Tax=Sulfurovum sp. TaxID=1969726 RepID=UPI002867FD70|nr:mechanosensitive ion channel domain-containing protein [Sulfurovum sp.]
MKLFTLIYIFTLSLWSADIDAKLYEGNNTIAYHQEVSRLIDLEPSLNQEDEERIAAERMILGKLATMLSFEPNTNSFPEALLPDDRNISTENYFSFLNALTDIYVTIDALKEDERIVQSKLQYLNGTIRDTTAENKKNLLLNQLEYAFYKLKIKNNALSMQAYETLLIKEEKRFVKKLKQATFNINALEKNLADFNTKYSIILQEETALNLSKERELMQHNIISEALSKKLLANGIEKMNILTAKINQTLLLSLAYVQKNDTTKVLDLFQGCKADILTLDAALRKHFTFKRNIIKTLLSEEVGAVPVALSNVQQGAESLYEYTYEKLTEPLFVFNEHGISTVDILTVIFIFIFGFIIAGFYKRKIMKLATKHQKLSLTSAKMMSNIGYYIIVLTTLLLSLKSIGLDLSNLGLIAGALSIGIGFGLQTVVSNLAAGIILMFERTIRLGDYIEVSDTIRGTVNDMKMRSTTITTNDNIDVIIPNSSFIQNNVINWTLENDFRRIHIPFSVAYGTSNEKVEEVILEELKHSGINYVEIPSKYTTLIWMTAMGASSVDYELVVWVRGLSTLRPTGTKSDFLKFIYATLNKHQIEIPFPQMDLHVKKSKVSKESDLED